MCSRPPRVLSGHFSILKTFLPHSLGSFLCVLPISKIECEGVDCEFLSVSKISGRCLIVVSSTALTKYFCWTIVVVVSANVFSAPTVTAKILFSGIFHSSKQSFLPYSEVVIHRGELERVLRSSRLVSRDDSCFTNHVSVCKIIGMQGTEEIKAAFSRGEMIASKEVCFSVESKGEERIYSLENRRFSMCGTWIIVAFGKFSSLFSVINTKNSVVPFASEA